MKTEKFKATPKSPRTEISDKLRSLQVDEALRIKTAGEFSSTVGRLMAIGKSRGVKFSTMKDGDDVLIFIKP